VDARAHESSLRRNAEKGEAGVFSGDNRVEFIDGKIVETTANGWRHAQYVTRLDMSLARFADEQALAGRY
jgi:hypothetical protein